MFDQSLNLPKVIEVQLDLFSPVFIWFHFLLLSVFEFCPYSVFDVFVIHWFGLNNNKQKQFPELWVNAKDSVFVLVVNFGSFLFVKAGSHPLSFKIRSNLHDSFIFNEWFLGFGSTQFHKRGVGIFGLWTYEVWSVLGIRPVRSFFVMFGMNCLFLKVSSHVWPVSQFT